MGNSLKIFLHAWLILLSAVSYSQNVEMRGVVSETKTGKKIEGVLVRLSNTTFATITDNKGEYSINVPVLPAYKFVFTHISYEGLSKNIKFQNVDSLTFIKLALKTIELDSVPVYAIARPETLVGKPDYSIFDFDFYEDKLFLLSGKSLSKPQVQLADYSGKIFSTFIIPKYAGSAQHFFHDYEGYTDLVCKDSVFRIDVINNSLLIYKIGANTFNKSILPVSDTLGENIYYKAGWDKYPVMNYYYLKNNDTISRLLKNITNADLLKLYNLEYFYLPSRLQLEARRMAAEYKTDEKIVAAMMSGFTQSMFYEPLYAPLLVIKDTVCIFNHHNDFLYHYDKNNLLIDSVKISYHHPKNWREWKKQLYMDELENKIYALFSKDGHHYLKEINYQTGKENSTYKLKHHSAQKIKIRNGYVYYVYRPFESTQEKFLYRERIAKN